MVYIGKTFLEIPLVHAKAEEKIAKKEAEKAAKAKRQSETANSVYRWAALAIVLVGVASCAFGIYAFVTDLNYASYLVIFGLAIILLFGRIFPTKRNSKAYIDERWKNACEAVEKHIKGFKPMFLVENYR